MALVTVFLVGLVMLSDVGISPSIQQSARGDEREFVDTAWTIQVLRGALLWAACFILGPLAAQIYGEEQLATMLPVAGLSLLIAGFTPTQIDTASRHLLLGRVTALDLAAQVLTLAGNIVLALILKSVWALILGGVADALIRLAIMHFFLKGHRNRFLWDVTAVREIISFGKWIFLSTLFGFLLAQGDKAILGKYLSLEKLGIYNIGFFLASVPQALAASIMSRVMIPLHREKPPALSADNFAKIQRTRYFFSGAVIFLQCALAFSGVWLVDLLYDSNYQSSGSVLVAIACMNVPYLVGMTYDYAALAAGDSRGLFYLLLAKVILQIPLFISGMTFAGLPGALFGIWLSQVLVHPLVIRLARKHGAWDGKHDLFFGLAGTAVSALVILYQKDHLLELFAFQALQ